MFYISIYCFTSFSQVFSLHLCEVCLIDLYGVALLCYYRFELSNIGVCEAEKPLFSTMSVFLLVGN